MRNILKIACALLLLASPCYAEPEKVNSVRAALPTASFLYSSVSLTLQYPSVLGYRGYEIPKVEDLPTPPLSNVFKDFNTHLSWRRYSPVFENYWTSGQRSRVTTRYKGLHGVIYRRLVREIEKYFDKQLNILYENSMLHPMDLQAKQREFNLARRSNSWWAGRNWMDFLPPEKGGLVTYVHTIGQDITVISLGPLQAKNTGKISLRGWGLALRQGPAELGSIPTLVETGKIPLNERERVSVAIAAPEESFFSNDAWSLKGNLRVNVRPTWNLESEDWARNRTKVRGNLRLLFMGRRRRPWLSVKVEVSIKPFRQEAEVTLQIALLTF